MKTSIIFICLLLVTNFAIAEEKTVDYSKKLSNKLTNLKRMMGDESIAIEIKRKKLKAILPTKEDFKILFPKDSDMLWSNFEGEYLDFIQNVDKGVTELSKEEWIKIEVLNLREKGTSKRYEKILKKIHKNIMVGDLEKRYEKVWQLIPKNIPVFHVVKKTEKHFKDSGPYIFINGRWIYFNRLTDTPVIISKIENKK